MAPNRARAPARPRRPAGRSARRSGPRSIPLPYNVPVSQVLSAPAILVGADAVLFDAMVLMRTHHVSGLPVIEPAGEVVGVLSQKDLARVLAGASEFPEITGLLDVLMAGLRPAPDRWMPHLLKTLQRTHVREAMSSPAFVVRPEATLEFAAEVMQENGINRLPVVDGGRLIGVVTRHDLAKALLPPVRPR